MSTKQLEDTVNEIIKTWVEEGKLFTALDVSLEVKKTMPFARHREVRDVVRSEYADMQSSGYGRTDIDVTLNDGSTTKAMLYHPLSDSWDLDAKYDAQKRAQTLKASTATSTPAVVAPTSVTPVSPQPTVADLIKQKLAQNIVPVPTVNPNKHLWDALFDTAPSLFPRR